MLVYQRLRHVKTAMQLVPLCSTCALELGGNVAGSFSFVQGSGRHPPSRSRRHMLNYRDGTCILLKTANSPHSKRGHVHPFSSSHTVCHNQKLKPSPYLQHIPHYITTRYPWIFPWNKQSTGFASVTRFSCFNMVRPKSSASLGGEASYHPRNERINIDSLKTTL